jgi:phosphate transport system substrate-binding protein
VAADPAIHGAGSSAAAPLYRSWATEYQKSSGVTLAYETTGSSAGLKKIRARETDFGASDVSPSDAELAKDGLVVFPIAVTGIVPVINLPKVTESQLRLSGEVLARIFLGEITQWSAPEIAQLNPDLALPKLAIRVVARSDGSGTTYNFADFLAKVSPIWREKNGVKTGYDWPTSFLSVKGSDGVVAAVKQTSGAIGYVDYGYVKDNQLNAVQMKNAEGEFIKPSVLAIRAALISSEWTTKSSFTSTLTNLSGKGVWPITMGTFALLPKVADKPEQTQRALKFFVWGFSRGDAQIQQNNFVRLPDRMQASIFKLTATIKDTAGKSIALAN